MQEPQLLALLLWAALETLRENMCLLTAPQIPLERITADITVENTLYRELLEPQLFPCSRTSVFLGMPIFAHHSNLTT